MSGKGIRMRSRISEIGIWHRWSRDNEVPFLKRDLRVEMCLDQIGNGEHRFANEIWGAMAPPKSGFDVLSPDGKRVEVKAWGIEKCEFRTEIPDGELTYIYSRVMGFASQSQEFFVQRAKNLTLGQIFGKEYKKKSELGLIYWATDAEIRDLLYSVPEKFIPSVCLLDSADLVVFVTPDGWVSLDAALLDEHVDFIGFRKGDAKFKTSHSLQKLLWSIK
jgi:hypothetical protein